MVLTAALGARAVEPAGGIEIDQNISGSELDICFGPNKVCSAMETERRIFYTQK